MWKPAKSRVCSSHTRPISVSGVMPSFSARSMIGGAVGVVGAQVAAVVAAHFLETHPDVGLDIFDQVAEMDAAIGVGQGGGDEDLAGHEINKAGRIPNGHKSPPFYRLEARAGLFQKLKFFRRGRATQNVIAMREAAEACNHVAMLACVIQIIVE